MAYYDCCVPSTQTEYHPSMPEELSLLLSDGTFELHFWRLERQLAGTRSRRAQRLARTRLLRPPLEHQGGGRVPSDEHFHALLGMYYDHEA